MIRGIIRPNGRPGFIHCYIGGHINLVGPRPFEVDDRPRKDGEVPARVIDEQDKPLVLTREVFNDIIESIKNGGAMAIEPGDGEDDEDAGDLKAELKRAVNEVYRLQDVVGQIQQQLVEKDALLREASTRIGDLEQQLATAKAAAAPAAPAAEKPAKATK